MKRYISHILCAILTLSSALRPADAFAAGDGKDKNVSYLDVIGFEGREVVKDAREVNLNMNIVLDSTKIRTQHTVSLTPVIISRDGKDTTAFGAVTRYSSAGTGSTAQTRKGTQPLPLSREKTGKNRHTLMFHLSHTADGCLTGGSVCWNALKAAPTAEKENQTPHLWSRCFRNSSPYGRRQ